MLHYVQVYMQMKIFSLEKFGQEIDIEESRATIYNYFPSYSKTTTMLIKKDRL